MLIVTLTFTNTRGLDMPELLRKTSDCVNFGMTDGGAVYDDNGAELCNIVSRETE